MTLTHLVCSLLSCSISSYLFESLKINLIRNWPSKVSGSKFIFLFVLFRILYTDILIQNSLKAPVSKRKSLKISSFKGNVQNDESGGRKHESKSVSVKLSYVPHDRNETLPESAKVKNNHATPTSNMDGTTAGSLAIQHLFRSWLTLLRTPSSPSQLPNGTLEERSCSNETVETDHKKAV